MSSKSTSNNLQLAYPLKCTIQNYAWGKPGKEGVVGQIHGAQTDNTAPRDLDTPFAEYWMGTHTNGPSQVLLGSSNQTQDHHHQQQQQLPFISLRDFLQNNYQQFAGDLTAENQRLCSQGQLPFLFKVLSVKKSLSIQAHPDQKLAKQLHERAPDKYKDDNHKPELAIAITPFEALCCFRPLQEISEFITSVPELNALLGADISNQCSNVQIINSNNDDKNNDNNRKKLLKAVFKRLMENADSPRVEAQVRRLVNRISSKSESERSFEEKLVLRLDSQFPGEVGCFAVFFLNYTQLEPGQALFMAPNEPHAYLSGNCVECMACSDNVVRAGLTPKFKDINTLCSMLTYNDSRFDELFYQGTVQKEGKGSTISVFTPPVEEFFVQRVIINRGNHEPVSWTIPSLSILIAINGTCSCKLCSQDSEQEESHNISMGSTLLISGGTTVNMTNQDDENDTIVFIAAAH